MASHPEHGGESLETRRGFVLASSANVAGNLVKIGVEGYIGVTFGSVALLADAAHSIADLLGSTVVLIWGRVSLHDADEEHPHGHQRIEPLTALFVGALIVLIALLLLRESALKLIEGVSVEFRPILIIGLGIAVLDMFLVYWYTKKTNKEIGSAALDALARDCLNDIYTSIAVLFGVIGIWLGYPVFDPIAGGLVALLVLYQGLDISRENINYLVGTAPPQGKRDEILEVVLSRPEVQGVHDYAAHYIGPEIEVEMHVEIDDDYTIREAHDIETAIYNELMAMEEIGDVHIHLDPAGIGEWKSRTESHESGLKDRDKSQEGGSD